MSHKRHLDGELNLIPFIDLLSVCICFLLLTAVWLQVGSMDVKQAVGGQPASETAKKAVVWVFMGEKGDLSFDVKDSRVSGALAKAKIPGIDGKPNLEMLSQHVHTLKSMDQSLATVLIQPHKESFYEDIVSLMDSFKKEGLSDLGVAPL
ncbi:MAG: biopolymer transporter ExbD [Proteobacteria bacterium]|jgi:biopolymer transport protein ExbD|nr:biopolymer transporter ExbD [Pseudomonadota bacterium]